MHRDSTHIIINGWFYGQAGTGSGQYLHHLIDHLPRVAPGHHFTLLCPDSNPIVNHPLSIVNLPLPGLPTNLAKLWWEQISVPRAARQLSGEVLWIPYWAAPLWQPVPTVVTVHDLIPQLLPAYRGGLQHRLYNRLVQSSARRSAGVITISQASARDVVTHLGIPGERVFAIHHGPNQGEPIRDEQLLAQIRIRYGLPARYFLYLGGFDVRKNVETTLLAYARYLQRGGDAGVKLVLAGSLPDHHTKFTPDPRRLAADLGLTEQLYFPGWVAEADKPALYTLAVAYLFPSLYEGFGMMVLEAMQAGTPVVTSAR